MRRRTDERKRITRSQRGRTRARLARRDEFRHGGQTFGGEAVGIKLALAPGGRGVAVGKRGESLRHVQKQPTALAHTFERDGSERWMIGRGGLARGLFINILVANYTKN